jgi:glycosyltransferase involved in cell wall biosynthesis
VDIVHARSRAPAWSAWLACRRTGAHFMTTWHGVYGEDLPFKRRYNAVMGKGERVIAISHFIGNHLTSRYHVDPARVRLIPRGVDPDLFDPSRVTADRIERLARQWRLPDGAPVVMLPGRLSRWKGQEVLVQALALLARRDAVAVLVGADQGRRRYAEGLLHLAARLGVRDRLFLAGQCDDMPAALMLADIVVHASITPEAFGRVVIEAQAMRRLVIATDQGGPAETVEHGVTGWRVKPGDPAALAGALDHALALSPEGRDRIGEAAQVAVLQNYTTCAMQDATLHVYRELLG